MIMGIAPVFSQGYTPTYLQGEILKSAPRIDGKKDSLWDSVPNIETIFLFNQTEIPVTLKIGYYLSSLYFFGELKESSSISNDSFFMIYLDLDESNSKSEGDMLLNISFALTSPVLMSIKYDGGNFPNKTVNPPFSQLATSNDKKNGIWSIEFQLITVKNQITFEPKEQFSILLTYKRTLQNGVTSVDTSFDELSETDLLSKGSWDGSPIIQFPPFNAEVYVEHKGIENIDLHEDLAKIVTYISFGSYGPIKNLEILVSTPIKINAFTGISSELIANTLIQGNSIKISVREAENGGMIRLTYFLELSNITEGVYVWPAINVSYVNSVGQNKFVSVGGPFSFSLSLKNTEEAKKVSGDILSQYNITKSTEEEKSLFDLLFPISFRNFIVQSVALTIFLIGINIGKNWYYSLKHLEEFERTGMKLIISIISEMRGEDPNLLKSFTRRAYLDLEDSKNLIVHKIQYHASSVEDISFYWIKFLNSLLKRIKVYYGNSSHYSKLQNLIFKNFQQI